jgi:hypothetical protein
MCALSSTAERRRGNGRGPCAAVAALGIAIACLSGCGDGASGQREIEIDLLREFDVSKHVNRGNATLDDGLYFTAIRGACQACFPQFDPPDQYDLQVDVIREGESGAVVIGLYAWGQQCRVVLDQPTDAGPLTGLAPLDGKWPDQEGYPNPLSGGVLAAGEPSTVLCQVRRDTLVVQCNQVVIINLNRETAVLGKLSRFEIPHEKALSVGTLHGMARITRMVVRTLPAS